MPRQQIFTLDIITPHGTLFSDNVVHVAAPGKNGRFGVLVNHMECVTLLAIGRVDVQAIQGNRHFTISGGVAEVKDNRMKILTRAAEDVSDIDIERAQRAEARAEKRLSRPTHVDLARAKEALQRAQNRLRAIKGDRS